MSAPPNNNLRVDRAESGVALVDDSDRADRFNTLSIDTLEEFEGVVDDLSTDDGVRAIVITGAGGESFAAGADIREFAGLEPREAVTFARRGQRFFDRL